MVDSNEIIGGAREMGGKVKQAAGRLVGDVKTRGEGYYDQAAGAAQQAYGQARDAAGDYGSMMLDQIEEAGDYLAERVDERPITAILVAAGVGFLFALLTKPSSRYR